MRAVRCIIGWYAAKHHGTDDDDLTSPFMSSYTKQTEYLQSERSIL